MWGASNLALGIFSGWIYYRCLIISSKSPGIYLFDAWIFVQWLLGGWSYGMAECICVKKKLTLWYIYLDLPSPSSVIFMLVLVIFFGLLHFFDTYSDYCLLIYGKLGQLALSLFFSLWFLRLDLFGYLRIFEVGTSILDYYRWYFVGTILVQEGKWDTWSFVSRWIILWIIWCVGTSVIFEIFMWYLGRSLVADSWR